MPIACLGGSHVQVLGRLQTEHRLAFATSQSFFCDSNCDLHPRYRPGEHGIAVLPVAWDQLQSAVHHDVHAKKLRPTPARARTMLACRLYMLVMIHAVLCVRL